MAQKYSIQLLTATTAQWNESQYVIPEGELVAELLTNGKVQLKVGNGLHKFSDLPYLSDKGIQGDPGFSPTIAVSSKKDGVTTVTITDKTGDQVVYLNDGISPTVTTNKVDGVTTVTIATASGDQEFYINDGISPTVDTSKTDGVATITITDGSGEHTFEVKDGDKGDPLTFADLTDKQKLELKGATGEGFVIQGTYDTLGLLTANVTSPSPGIVYGVGVAAPYDIYIYDGVKEIWVNHGQLKGAKGEDGTSPVVSMSKDNGVTTITVLDVNGQQSVDILDGSSATVVVDTEISDTSENTVQNKVIKAYIDGLIGDVESAVAEINSILGGTIA